jgi:3-(3-hydroxy-phenyl)propionate hydroxylase
VEFATEFQDVFQEKAFLKVKTSKGEIHAPWLVGCDGGRSAVRKNVGTEFEGFTWPERFIVVSTGADFAPLGFTSNAYVADPKEWAAVFHMPGVWRLAFPVHPDEDEEAVLEREAVEARMQRFVARPGRYDVSHKGIYKVHQRVAKEWRAGRILLAGDSAHLNNPLGAFGLNGGLHDAILLGECLGKVWRGEAGEELLDLYVRKRRTANIELERAARGRGRLEHRRASVDHDGLAGEEGGIRAGEEAHRAHQVFGRLVALDRSRGAGDLASAAMFWIFGDSF